MSQVHITLRGLAIFGSPFLLKVEGGGQYVIGNQLQAARASDKTEPTREEVEAGITANPSVVLYRVFHRCTTVNPSVVRYQVFPLCIMVNPSVVRYLVFPRCIMRLHCDKILLPALPRCIVRVRSGKIHNRRSLLFTMVDQFVRIQ